MISKILIVDLEMPSSNLNTFPAALQLQYIQTCFPNSLPVSPEFVGSSCPRPGLFSGVHFRSVY